MYHFFMFQKYNTHFSLLIFLLSVLQQKRLLEKIIYLIRTNFGVDLIWRWTKNF